MALSKPTSAVKLPSLAHAIAKLKGAPSPVGPNAGIAAQAQAEIDPILKAVTDRVNAKAQAGMGAISGYTQQLASQLGGYQQKAQDIYSGAQQSQAATDAALSNRLSGGGSELADQLAARLAGINAPAATGAAAANVAQAGAGAGNALYGKGSASQSALIAQGAGAQDYAAKLPGVAALGGLQAGKELQLKSASDLADKTAQVETQLPTIINQIRGQQQSANQYNQTRSDRQAAQQDLNKYRTDSLTARGGSFKIVKGADGYYRVNPDGSTSPLGISPPATGGSGGKTHLQSKTVNGHTVTFDPTTGAYYIPGTTTPVDPNTLTKPPAKVSPTDLRKARGYVQQQVNGFYASQADPSKPVGASAIAAAAKAAGFTVGDFLADTPDAAKARAAAGIGWNQVPHGRENWPEVQQLYVTLVKQYGVPARQAFAIVAGTYKEWGKAHQADYFPKADAGAEPASYTGGRLTGSQQTQLAQRALQAVAPNLATPDNVQALVGRINQESGGNPAAVNNWDSNAKAGHPSKGLLQTIDSTFASYALPGHGNIWDPYDNTLAAVRYMLSRYGRIVGPSNTGY